MSKSSNPIFIDVDASTPVPVKQEHEEMPECGSDLSLSLLLPRAHKDTSTPDGLTTDRGQRRHKCGMCDYSTAHSALITEHCNRHKGVKPYKCSQCPYHSASKRYAKVHELRHAGGGGGGVAGGPCGAGGERPPPRALHARGASKQSCEQCALPGRREAPARLGAARGGGGGGAATRADKFACTQCAFTASSDHKILLHLIHHPQRADCVDVTVLVTCGILPGAAGASGILPGAAGTSGILPGAAGTSGILPGAAGASGILPGAAGASGILPGAAGTRLNH